MPPSSGWPAIARFAWRDLHASRTKAAFLIAALGVSIGSVGGVHSAATTARGALLLDSRVWLAGDISVTTGDALDGDQIAALDRMRQSRIDWTLVTWMTTRATSDESPDPALVTVKVVDPNAYPFYGAIQLKPQQTLAAALDPESVAVSDDVLTRLQVHVGGHIRIGGKPFRITALIQAEPDRFTGSLGLGPRCIVSARAYQRSGIARSGNPDKYRVLLRLPAGARIEEARRRLREIVPEGNILAYREANRHAIESVDQAVLFLEIVALLVLLLGALSIAVTVQQHLNARLDAFAIMKAIGARSAQILAIFALQTGLLLAAGFAVSLPIVWVFRRAILTAAGSYFVLLPVPVVNVRSIGYIALAGLAAVSPAILQVAFQLKQLRPALLLRREAGEATPPSNHYQFMAALMLLLVFAILSALTLDTWRATLLLLSALGALVLLVIAFARGLLNLLRRLHTDSFGPPGFRVAIRNISRLRHRSAAVISALALGFMIMAATFVLQRSIAEAILGAFPLDRANLLILRVAEGDEDNVRNSLAGQTGIGASIDIITLAKLRLTRVNGVPLESLGEAAQADAFVNLVGCDSTQPPGQVAVAADVARLISAKLGSRLEFTSRHGTISTSVSAVPNLTSAEKFWRTFVINCGGLDKSDEFHQIAARIPPDRMAAAEQALAANYPTLPTLTAAEVVATIDRVSRDAIGLIRTVAWYAIIAATSVMIAIVSASSTYRLHETAVLSALGARRKIMLTLYSVEFVAIGALAGLLGVLGAWGLDSVILIAVLHQDHAVFPSAVIPITILAAMLLSFVAGWLPCYRLLRQKPFAILRRE